MRRDQIWQNERCQPGGNPARTRTEGEEEGRSGGASWINKINKTLPKIKMSDKDIINPSSPTQPLTR